MGTRMDRWVAALIALAIFGTLAVLLVTAIAGGLYVLFGGFNG